MKVAIASGKGGTGKTTLSTNLASYLGKNERVVLVDLDVEEPNAKLFLQTSFVDKKDQHKNIPNWQKDSCTYCKECVSICNFNALIALGDKILLFPNLCHSCYACSELCTQDALPMVAEKMGELTHYRTDDIDFIEGRLMIGEEQAVGLISKTKKYIETYFSDDTIKIYDAPPGTSCPVIEAVKDVDFVILVSEPTPFGLHDLKLAVETMRALHMPFGVVVNRDGIGDDRLESYCKAENIPLLAKIPHDIAVAKLYSDGKLAYQEVDGVRNAVKEIADFMKNMQIKDEL